MGVSCEIDLLTIYLFYKKNDIKLSKMLSMTAGPPEICSKGQSGPRQITTKWAENPAAEGRTANRCPDTPVRPRTDTLTNFVVRGRHNHEVNA